MRNSSEAGLSLMEVTVMLMTVAVLTAVVAPAVGNYITDAQQAAAKKDVESIGAALTRMLADVGEAWFVRNGARTGTATNQAAPSHGANTRVDLMVSDGTIPTLAATARPSGTDWTAAVDNAAVQKLENYLVLNTPSGLTANAYRTAATMTGAGNFDPDGAGGFNSPYAWRGAYLPGPINADPWGERYAVNVEFLARTQGSNGSGSRMDVIVLSAGINEQIDTAFEVDGTAATADDIVALVSGATR
jgi:Tfp pilus assembly protein PilE